MISIVQPSGKRCVKDFIHIVKWGRGKENINPIYTRNIQNKMPTF